MKPITTQTQAKAVEFLKHCNEYAQQANDKKAFTEWQAENKEKMLDCLYLLEGGLVGYTFEDALTEAEVIKAFSEINTTVARFICIYPDIAQSQVKATISAITKVEFLEANQHGKVKFEESQEGFEAYIRQRLQGNLLALYIKKLVKDNKIDEFIERRALAYNNVIPNKVSKFVYPNDAIAKAIIKACKDGFAVDKLDIFEGKNKKKEIHSFAWVNDAKILEALRKNNVNISLFDEMVMNACISHYFAGNEFVPFSSIYKLITGQKQISEEWLKEFKHSVRTLMYIPFTIDVEDVFLSFYGGTLKKREGPLLPAVIDTVSINNNITEGVKITSEPPLLTIAKAKTNSKNNNQLQEIPASLLNIEGVKRNNPQTATVIYCLLKRIKDMAHTVMSKIIVVHQLMIDTGYPVNRKKRLIELTLQCFYEWIGKGYIKGVTYLDKGDTPLLGIEATSKGLCLVKYKNGKKKTRSLLKKPPTAEAVRQIEKIKIIPKKLLV